MKKIKVLQYVSCMNRAGAETLLMNIYRNIDREKFEFHFISHKKEECDYDEEIKKLGGKVIFLERPSLKTINNYKNDFKNIVDEYGPYDVIHTHMQLINGLILKIAKDCKIKNRVCHAHLNGDYTADGIFRYIYRKYSKYLIKENTTYRIACSDESGKYLYDGKKFKLLNNAIDLKKFDCGNIYINYLNKEFDLNYNIKKIAHIGRFVEAKNHKFIIKVFSELIKKEKNYRLFLCGEGPLKNEIENIVKELKIEEYVYFIGVRDDINKILLSSDLYFMPSILEGLPVALIEAQAAGCECVISDNIPESSDVGIGIVKRLSLNSEIDEWVKEIDRSIKNKKVNFEEIKLKMIESGFDLEKNTETLMKIYEGVYEDKS